MKYDKYSHWLGLKPQVQLTLAGLATFGLVAAAWGIDRELTPQCARKPHPQDAKAKQTAPSLPPLPEGVAELKFSEFFVTPVGDRGLTLTEKLRSLDGKRVRIMGYMVRREQTIPGEFLLTSIPVQIHDLDDGLADSLPAATLLVVLPKDRDQAVPYTPGILLLSGILSVGNREGPDGRISTVRLALDPPQSAASKQFSPSQKGAGRFLKRTNPKRNAAP